MCGADDAYNAVLHLPRWPFGLDKLHDIDRTVADLEVALDKVVGASSVR